MATTFGTFIRDRRKELSLSQTEVAQACGFNTGGYVSHWERGFAPMPERYLKPLAKVLKVSAKQLGDLYAASGREKAASAPKAPKEKAPAKEAKNPPTSVEGGERMARIALWVSGIRRGKNNDATMGGLGFQFNKEYDCWVRVYASSEEAEMASTHTILRRAYVKARFEIERVSDRERTARIAAEKLAQPEVLERLTKSEEGQELLIRMLKLVA